MPATPDQTFLGLLNENLGIAHKIARAYFSNTDDREDCLQEMVYQLWRSYPHFQGKSKFSTWMYQVCLNTALTYRKRNSTNNEPLNESHLNVPGSDDRSDEDIDQLFKAIATLTPVNKAIILLYLEDMSYEEIATITGLTKSNVSVKLVRIKKELESKLQNIRD